jgi:phospholipid/cholesterol/gamma-HCH transport system substrate-binding protein
VITKLAVIAGLMLSGVGGWTVYDASQPYTVKGYFLSAENVVPANDVVIGGATAGSVKSVELNPDETSTAQVIVTIQIDNRFAPLHKGTRLEIRPKGLLGNMFIDLTPGPATAPAIARGGSIPLQDTAAPVSLDQVNDIFDAQTREKVKTATLEGGKAFDQRGQDLNNLLAQLPQISADAADTTGAIDQRQQELDALQVEFDRVAYMWASEDESFRRDLANGASLLDVMAAHQQALQDQFVYLNASLAEVNGGLSGHEGDLNASLKEMPQLLQDLQAFQSASTYPLNVSDYCINDILATLAEMQDATKYNDGNGAMLRVDTTLAGDSRGQDADTPATEAELTRFPSKCSGYPTQP